MIKKINELIEGYEYFFHNRVKKVRLERAQGDYYVTATLLNLHALKKIHSRKK